MLKSWLIFHPTLLLVIVSLNIQNDLRSSGFPITALFQVQVQGCNRKGIRNETCSRIIHNSQSATAPRQWQKILRITQCIIGGEFAYQVLEFAVCLQPRDPWILLVIDSDVPV